MTNWINSAEKKPEQGREVLAWHPDRGFEICRFDGDGSWHGPSEQGEDGPSHWMPLPDTPADAPNESGPSLIRGDIVEDRLMLDIDEDKETIAVLMQHFLEGDAAVVNGERRFIVDMKNEIVDGKMISIFFLGK
jgi:hypothetical protein